MKSINLIFNNSTQIESNLQKQYNFLTPVQKVFFRKFRASFILSLFIITLVVTPDIKFM